MAITAEHGNHSFLTHAERMLALLGLLAVFKAVRFYNDPNGPIGINMVSIRAFDQRVQGYITKNGIHIRHDQLHSYLTEYCEMDLKDLQIELDCREVNPFE